MIGAAPVRPPGAASAALETAALVHAGLVLVFASWAFGGNAAWSREVLCWLGSLGFLLTAAEFLRRVRSPEASLASYHWLWPLLVFDLLVASSTLHPSFHSVHVEGADVFLPTAASAALTSARPSVTWRALWLFNALFIPAFNLAVSVRRRSRLRALLFVVAANAVMLAVFGALQKLSHASGLFFGAVPSPNARFFASFIYANHWGAFATLMVCCWLGLLFHDSAETGRYRDFLHSPAFAGFIAALILAGAVPLAASRSATLLVALVLLVGLGHAFRRLRRRRSGTSHSSWLISFSLLTAAAVGLLGSLYLAKSEILTRSADTREQVAEMRRTSSVGARAQLYADTWRMARDRVVFGWGLGSYPTVFVLYNRQSSKDGLPVYFEDAHSDWLQSVAEVGVVGSACRGLLILLPLAALWKGRPRSPLVLYPLGGCAVLLAYAWVEFPFGNAAVTAAFWFSFFSAVRLAQLEARDRET